MCVITIEGWQIVADVVGHLAWPAVVAVLALFFRKPIVGLIGSIEGFEWGKGKVALGNQRTKSLKSDSADAAIAAAEAAESAQDAAVEEPVPLFDVPGERPTDAHAFRTVALKYYGRIVVDRLRGSKYNVSTTSAKLGAEIVGSTYADLKQAVRVVALHAQGIGGMRGPLLGLETILQQLEISDDLAADIMNARRVAIDVTNGSIKVDGQGASDYIDSVHALVARLVDWGARKVAAAAQ